MKYIGNSIFQLGPSDPEKYLSVMQENARQSLKLVGREDCLDRVEYFFNRQQENEWICGWKVGLT